MLAPDTERGLSLKSALGNLQRYEFVLAIFQSRFGGIVRLHVSKHFRIFHKFLQV
jgi:hypothetical protein